MLSEIETSCSATAFGNDAFDGTRTLLLPTILRATASST